MLGLNKRTIYTYVIVCVLFVVFKTPSVAAENLCESGEIYTVVRNDAKTFNFKSFPYAEFTTEENCDHNRTCNYALRIEDPQITRKIRKSSLDIHDICRAFTIIYESGEVKKRQFPNSFTEGLTAAESKTYYLSNDFGELWLEARTYYIPQDETYLGHWHGIDTGGTFLRLVNTYFEVTTSWIK